MTKRKIGWPGASRRSLGTRLIIFVVAGELLFGLVLGLTVGLYSLRTAAEQRTDSLRQVTGAVAASLMPIIADQDRAHVDAQMKSILALAGSDQITCIRIEDATGNTIASSSGLTTCCPPPTKPDVLATFADSQVVEEPVTVNGLVIARVFLQFRPPGLERALAPPLLAAALVVVSVALISAPWTAWLFVKNVSEPLSDLRDGAAALAEGKRDHPLSTGRQDEIGELAEALDHMADQITAQEERLRESYGRMEVAFEAEAEAKRELEAVVKMKSDFVAVASHEIRAPLAIIRTYAELLEGGELGRLGKAAREAVGAIVSASGRLTSTVSDLMDAALLERGLMPLEFAEVHVEPLLRHAVRDLDTLSRSRGVTVRLQEPVPDSYIKADATRIRQVLDNLISNAVKYSNGAELVVVGARVTPTGLEVDVVDRGIGIPKNRKRLLFRLFGRLDADDNRETAGLGLGLAISARIAEAHGGRIVCGDNPEGRGTVFTLHLPANGGGPAGDNAMMAVMDDTEEAVDERI